MNSSSHAVATPDNLTLLYKALGDVNRIEILRVLATDSYGVLELADIFQVTQPRISHHLKVLATAGLVSTRREGNSIFYRRPQLTPEDPLAKVKQSAFVSIDECATSSTTTQGLEHVHQLRADISRQFFIENAEKFRAQQDLIASYSVYAQAVTDLLDSSLLPSKNSALEIGPGEGEFLEVLGTRFENVIAIDNSTSMLEKARIRCTQNELNNVTLHEGDTQILANYNNQFDCAIINMVLHHTPSPLAIFKHIQPTLKAQAVLLICDLCLHDQAWTKEACGDVWLGFDPNDINSWALEAGFTSGQSVYLALRNGFQIQIKQFIKS